MKKEKAVDLGNEMAKILPLMLREVSRRQENILAKSDIAVSQIIVLDVLKEKGPCTMGELSGTLNLTMSAVTGIIDKMIKLGFVKRERSRDDRRVVNVALLAKGKKTVDRVNEARKNITRELYSVFTEKEGREYLGLINKVYDSLRKKK